MCNKILKKKKEKKRENLNSIMIMKQLLEMNWMSCLVSRARECHMVNWVCNRNLNDFFVSNSNMKTLEVENLINYWNVWIDKAHTPSWESTNSNDTQFKRNFFLFFDKIRLRNRKMNRDKFVMTSINICDFIRWMAFRDKIHWFTWNPSFFSLFAEWLIIP